MTLNWRGGGALMRTKTRGGATVIGFSCLLPSVSFERLSGRQHHPPATPAVAQVVEHRARQRAELRAAVINGRPGHRTEDPSGHVRGARDLEEMPSAPMWHPPGS